MAARSAGILLFRRAARGLEVLLVHPGGPFWAKKDAGAWSIPKGEFDDDETTEAAARREFQEELGVALEGELLPLGEVRQKAGKTVIAFAVEGNLDAGAVLSNSFQMEWPPRSGRMQSFPEIDRAAWFDLRTAHDKINPAQAPLLERLANLIGA